MATPGEKSILLARPRDMAKAREVVNEIEKAVELRIKKGYEDKGNKEGGPALRGRPAAHQLLREPRH